jgi:hypothetical protein
LVTLQPLKKNRPAAEIALQKSFLRDNRVLKGRLRINFVPGACLFSGFIF